MEKASPIRMNTAAPSAAPLETPSVNGVASGFLKSAWNDMPLSESIAPATKAASTRGMRMPSMISRSCPVAENGMNSMPKSGLNRSVATASRNRVKSGTSGFFIAHLPR